MRQVRILIGPDSRIAVEPDSPQAVLLASARVFKTKSRGFFASGKVVLDKKRYQVSCTIVEIGTKPKPKTTKQRGTKK